MIDPLHHILELAAQAAGVGFAEQGDDAVGGQQVKAQLAGTTKEGAAGPGPLEDEIGQYSS